MLPVRKARVPLLKRLQGKMGFGDNVARGKSCADEEEEGSRDKERFQVRRGAMKDKFGDFILKSQAEAAMKGYVFPSVPHSLLGRTRRR